MLHIQSFTLVYRITYQFLRELSMTSYFFGTFFTVCGMSQYSTLFDSPIYHETVCDVFETVVTFQQTKCMLNAKRYLSE